MEVQHKINGMVGQYNNHIQQTHVSTKDHLLDLQKLKQAIYIRHNNYRYLHNSPLLCWSAELAEFAQNWAEKVAERGYLQYSEHPALGENIVLADLTENCPTGEEIVDKWYEEKKWYNYSLPSWSKETYHFSQIIWRNSTEIGIGIQGLANRNQAVIVVNYKPAGNGNLPGEYEKNVLPCRTIDLKNAKKRSSCQNAF